MLLAVWAEYELASDEAGIKAAACTTIVSLWRQLVPHITHETYVRFMLGVPIKQYQGHEDCKHPRNSQITSNYETHVLTDVSLVAIHRCSRMQRNIYRWPLKKSPTTEVLLTQQRRY